MSALLDRADALAEYLATVDGLQTVKWRVMRGNLATDFDFSTLKKLKLGAITFTAGRNADQDLDSLRLACTGTATIFFLANLQAGDPEPDDIAELAARAIHGKELTTGPNARRERLHVTNYNRFDITDDETNKVIFRPIRITFECVVQFSSEAIPIIP